MPDTTLGRAIQAARKAKGPMEVWAEPGPWPLGRVWLLPAGGDAPSPNASLAPVPKDDPTIECPCCEGAGIHGIREDVDHWEEWPCRACNGDGTVPACEVCRGTGTTPDGMVDCPECDGNRHYAGCYLPCSRRGDDERD